MMASGENASDENARRETGGQPQRPSGGSAGRLARLCLKELREILRDRRTIFTLVLMPLLVYPLLTMAFQRFLLTSLDPTQEFVIGVESKAALEHVEFYLKRDRKSVV